MKKGEGCTYSEDLIYEKSNGEIAAVKKGLKLTIMKHYANNLTILRYGNRMFFAETHKLIKDE